MILRICYKKKNKGNIIMFVTGLRGKKSKSCRLLSSINSVVKSEKSDTPPTIFHRSDIQEESPRNVNQSTFEIIQYMRQQGMISTADFILYFAYCRITKEMGQSWFGTRALAEQTQLSAPTVTKCKRNLSRPFDFLGGKSLIKIFSNKESRESDTVVVVDIQEEEKLFLEKSYRESMGFEQGKHQKIRKKKSEYGKENSTQNARQAHEQIEDKITDKSPHRVHEEPVLTKQGVCRFEICNKASEQKARDCAREARAKAADADVPHEEENEGPRENLDKEAQMLKESYPTRITFTGRNGPITITQHHLFDYMAKAHPNISQKLILEAWKRLAKKLDVVYNWRKYISGVVWGMIEEISNKQFTKKQEELTYTPQQDSTQTKPPIPQRPFEPMFQDKKWGEPVRPVRNQLLFAYRR